MLKRILVSAVAFLVVMPVGAQTHTQAEPWRTPWGDPDLQGSWSNATTTPLERPSKYAGREFLTKQEQAAQNTVTAIATDKRDERGTPDDVNGAYNGFWWERGWSDGRTSLVYDPPTAVFPRRISNCTPAASSARRCHAFRPATTTITRSCRRPDRSRFSRSRFTRPASFLWTVARISIPVCASGWATRAVIGKATRS